MTSSGALNGCVPYGGSYGPSAVSSSNGDAFAIGLNPSGMTHPLNLNSVTVKVTTPAARTLLAKLYVNGTLAGGGTRIPTSGFGSIVDALNTVNLTSSVTDSPITFHFPVTGIPAGVDSSVVIYEATAANNFNLTGESPGSYVTPLTAPLSFSGTWTAAGLGNLPHAQIERCF